MVVMNVTFRACQSFSDGGLPVRSGTPRKDEEKLTQRPARNASRSPARVVHEVFRVAMQAGAKAQRKKRGRGIRDRSSNHFSLPFPPITSVTPFPPRYPSPTPSH